MKKASKAVPDASDDLRPEYAFDYTKAKPNPYAARLKGRTVLSSWSRMLRRRSQVSKAVNRQLRAVVADGAATLPEARRSLAHEAVEAVEADEAEHNGVSHCSERRRLG